MRCPGNSVSTTLFTTLSCLELFVRCEIPEDLVREEEFFRSYLNENGLAWHHHHNSTTPSPGAMPNPSRGPPSMHMWSASQVGETHDVFTEHGHW